MEWFARVEALTAAQGSQRLEETLLVLDYEGCVCVCV